MRQRTREILVLARGVLSDYREKRGATSLEDLIPIDIRDIADVSFDLRVRHVKNLGVELSGCLDAEARTIEINANELPARRRFTLGHEVGHFLLHARRGDARSFHRCSKRAVEAFEEIRAEAVLARAAYAELKQRVEELEAVERELGLEREANLFAAEILMPTEIVVKRSRQFDNSPARMAKKFEVSVESMTWKMTGLRLIQGFSKQKLLPWEAVRE